MNIPHPDNPQHVENLASIALLEAQGFDGPDVSLEISLFEYGIAWRILEKETLFIYAINGTCSAFDRCTIDNDIDPYKEWNWVEDWNVFYDPCELTKEEWDAYPLEQKVYDLLCHYGYENVFGSSYWEGFKIQPLTD